MIAAGLLALVVAGPPAVEVLDRVPAQLERLACYDRAAAALDLAELELAGAANGRLRREAGARWMAARRRLGACRSGWTDEHTTQKEGASGPASRQGRAARVPSEQRQP